MATRYHKQTPSVKVSRYTHNFLKLYAESRKTTIQTVVENALAAYLKIPKLAEVRLPER